MELQWYFDTLWKRRWMVMVIFVGAVLAAIVVSQLMAPVYEAGTTILLPVDEPGNVTLLRDEQLLQGVFDQILRHQTPDVQDSAEILKSRAFLLSVARGLNLVESPSSSEFRRLQKSVKITPIIGTNAIRVQVHHEDPAVARDVANRLVGEFVAHDQTLRRSDAEEARRLVSAQISIIGKELGVAEQAQRGYRGTHGSSVVSGLSSGPSDLDRRVDVLQKTYTALAQKLEEIRMIESMKISDIRVIDPATTPATPVRPKKALIVIVAGLLALLVGLGLVPFVEYISDSARMMRKSISNETDRVHASPAAPSSYS